MSFRCVYKPPCKTPTGRIRTFTTVENCEKHFRDVHGTHLTRQQALEFCLITNGGGAALQPFQPDDGSVQTAVIMPVAAPIAVSAAAANDLASVAVSSIGSLGISAMGITNEEQLLLNTLQNHRNVRAMLAAGGGGVASSIDEEEDDEEEEGGSSSSSSSSRSSSRLKIGKKIVVGKKSKK